MNEIKCENCGYCQYPRSANDNWGHCKCKAMKRKTIDVYVTGGETPEWCPLKNDKKKGEENERLTFYKWREKGLINYGRTKDI